MNLPFPFDCGAPGCGREKAFLVRGVPREKIFTNHPPFYQYFAIAVPVAVQNLITVGVSTPDNP